MSEPLIYVDHSDIRPGRLADLRAAMQELADFVESREPQLHSYGFFIDEEGSRMTVIAIHPDWASLELHLEIGGPAFRRFGELIELRRIDVYGETSERAMSLMREKARMLGADEGVVVHRFEAGFARFAKGTPPG